MEKIKDWPKWLRVARYISLTIVVLDIITLVTVWAPCLTRCDALGEAIITFIILLPILGITVVLWALGFLAYYLKTKEKTWIGSAVFIIGAAASAFVVLSTLMEYAGFRSFDFRGWFPLPFSLVLLIFFIVGTIFIKKKKSSGPEASVFARK